MRSWGMVTEQVDDVDALLERAMRLVGPGMTLQAAAKAIAEELDPAEAVCLWRRYGPSIIYSLLLQRAHQRRLQAAGAPRAQPDERAAWVRERAELIWALPVAYVDESGRRRIMAFGDMGQAEVRGAMLSHLDYMERHRAAAQRFERFLPYLQAGRRVRQLPPELVVALWRGEG